MIRRQVRRGIRTRCDGELTYISCLNATGEVGGIACDRRVQGWLVQAQKQVAEDVDRASLVSWCSGYNVKSFANEDEGRS